jgi:L-asparaginase II
LSDINSIYSNIKPIFSLTRKSIPEIIVSGLVHTKRQGEDASGHNPSVQLVGRSLLKPWQFLASDASGKEAFWSLGLASHSCQSVHLEQLDLLSKAAEAGENELYCPRSFPLDPMVSAKMKIDGQRPSRMHHPCSGKHLLMLAACNKNGMDPDSYFNIEHPIQKKLQSIVGQLIDEKPDWVLDSCGLPTLATSIRAHMNMWERMALSEEENIVTMKDLWTRNPVLVGGHERLDTAIMEIGEGKILAKEGADGLLMVQSIPVEGEPSFSILIKLAAGYQPAYLALSLWSVLSREENLSPAFANITDYLRSKLEKWVPGDQELMLAPF